MPEFQVGQRVQIQKRNSYFNEEQAVITKHWYNEKLAQGIVGLKLDDGREVHMSQTFLNPVVKFWLHPQQPKEDFKLGVEIGSTVGPMETIIEFEGKVYYIPSERVGYVQDES